MQMILYIRTRFDPKSNSKLGVNFIIGTGLNAREISTGF
jgi:hypothetical protein